MQFSLWLQCLNKVSIYLSAIEIKTSDHSCVDLIMWEVTLYIEKACESSVACEEKYNLTCKGC